MTQFRQPSGMIRFTFQKISLENMDGRGQKQAGEIKKKATKVTEVLMVA